MTVKNDFLVFPGESGANAPPQADRAGLESVATGYQASIDQSAARDKALRQSSIMASVIAQFIFRQTGQAAIDDGTTETLLANFTSAVNAGFQTK